jgi:uncharacterized protein YggE
MGEGTGQVEVTERWIEDVPATGAKLLVFVSGTKLFTGEAALEKAEEVRTLIEHLERNGAGEGDVALRSVSIEVSKGLLGKSSSATYQLSIRCSDLVNLPSFLDVITGQKSCCLNHIEWEYEGIEEKRHQWLRSCVRKARAKAAVMAEALDASLAGISTCAERSLGEPSIPGDPDRPWFGVTPSAFGAQAASVRASVSSSLGSGELAPAKKMGVEVRAVWSITA